jgi:2-polyprenyl-3-methyl-5-hydroxy-6-metoxy-1,4-benzoquinol methylase
MSFFDDRAADWDTPDRVERARILAAVLREHLTLTPESRAIEIGAGTGLLGLSLLGSVGSVVITDPSEGMVSMARRKIIAAGIANADTLVYDVPAEPPVGSPFDVAVSLLALHHVVDTDAVLRSIHGLLEPGGQMALIDLDAEDGSFHGHDAESIHHGFDRDTLMHAATSAGFVELDWRIVHHLERDGRTYPLFLLTGRKAMSSLAGTTTEMGGTD